MLRTILAALDATAASDPVLELALNWGRRFNALVVGLTIVDEPGVHGKDELILGEIFFRKLNAQIVAEARDRMDQAISRYAQACASAGVAFKPLQEVGDPSSEIIEEAQRFDLIMVGGSTHFRMGWENAADLTHQRILRDSPRPVVLVPDRERAATVTAGDAVLIAYDGSLPAARAVSAFVASGLGDGQPVHIVSVGQDKVEAARKADRAVEFLGSHKIAAVPHILASNARPAPLIFEQARDLKAGLIVMGAYGQPTLRDFFLGSTTRTALAECPFPLFLSH